MTDKLTTKEKLVNSALKLFSQKWFENTSTTSICKEAGFSSGALFVHFKTKNDLLDYIYTSVKKKYFSFVFSKIDQKLNPKKKTETIFRESIKYFLDNYEEFIFLKSFANSRHISRIAREEVEAEMTAFTQIFEEGKKQWFFIKEDTELILIWMQWIFYALIQYIKETSENNQAEIDNNVEKSVKIIMKNFLK